MHHLGAPRPGNGARTTPVPFAPPKRRSRLSRWFDSWMRSLGMAFVLFVIIKTFLVEAFQIPSGSMERTLLVGDFLFVNKAVYGAQIPGTNARVPGFESPRRGEVVVFAYPRNPEQTYVQRVDPTRDVADPEFTWQRRYYAGAPDDALRLHPTRDNWAPLAVPDGK